MARYPAHEQAESADRLRKLVSPGDTVYTIMRHRARSGMSRDIDLYVIKDNKPLNISYHAARVTGFGQACDGSLKVGGCGMDMGFHAVYTLSHALHPDGFQCIGDNCPSNDHTNGDRNRKPHQHNSGGYALRHSWM